MYKSFKVLGTLSGDPTVDLPYETRIDFSDLFVFMKENRQGRVLRRQSYGKTGVAATMALLMAAVSTDVQQRGLLNSFLKPYCLQREY